MLARMSGKTNINPTTARHVVGGNNRMGVGLAARRFTWMRCRNALRHGGRVRGAMNSKRPRALDLGALLCHILKQALASGCPMLTERAAALESVLTTTSFSYTASTIAVCSGRSDSVTKRDCAEPWVSSFVQRVVESGAGRAHNIFRLTAMVAEIQKDDQVESRVNSHE